MVLVNLKSLSRAVARITLDTYQQRSEVDNTSFLLFSVATILMANSIALESSRLVSGLAAEENQPGTGVAQYKDLHGAARSQQQLRELFDDRERHEE